MKTCTKCKQEKHFNKFNKNKSSKDGFAWWCKKCTKEHRIKTPKKKDLCACGNKKLTTSKKCSSCDNASMCWLSKNNPSDYIGMQYNFLKIISVQVEIQGRYSYPMAVCQCKCGEVCKKRLSYIKRSVVVACSPRCSNLCKGTSRAKCWENDTGELRQAFLNKIEHGARDRGIGFDLNTQECWQKFLDQGKQCALTGIPLSFPKNSKDYDGTASLDRIDSSKNYTIDNVQWVHKNINRMKWILSQEEFVEWCRKVVSHSG